MVETFLLPGITDALRTAHPQYVKFTNDVIYQAFYSEAAEGAITSQGGNAIVWKQGLSSSDIRHGFQYMSEATDPAVVEAKIKKAIKDTLSNFQETSLQQLGQDSIIEDAAMTYSMVEKTAKGLLFIWKLSITPVATFEGTPIDFTFTGTIRYD